jgi:hypothetical protein
MAVNLKIARLPVPELEMAGSGYFGNPRRGLVSSGPFDLRFGSAHRAQLRLAIVGPADLTDLAHQWFERCRHPIMSVSSTNYEETDVPYPGFQAIFRSELVTGERETIRIEQGALDAAMARPPLDAFGAIVNIYANAILQAKREFRPDVVVCAIPESIEKRYWSVKRTVSRAEKNAMERISARRASMQIELPLDWEPEESAEDLLTRDLRRALKAEAMRCEVPIQIVRKNTLIDLASNEAPHIRAWNLCVGLYYKGGGIPWRIRAQGPETCFVGVTFHHLRTTRRALVYSALAQAFSSNGEGFALKGSTLEPESDRRRTPHMTAAQAQTLGERVLGEYVARNGSQPKRIVLHKSSRFTDDEQMGFRSAFKEVPVLQMVALAPSSLRLVTHASYPPARGTLLTVADSRYFLFISGYIRELSTYPGPHVPAPVELIFHGDQSPTAIREASAEILALGRLNWNTSDLRSSQPVTLGFARRVGGIMAEYGLMSEKEPDPSYRYYM